MALFGGLVLVEQIQMVTSFPIAWTQSLETIIRFDENKQVVAAAGTVASLDFTVPRLPGMTELVVERAGMEVRGRRIDMPPVTLPKSGSSPEMVLQGGKGSLRQIDLKGIAVVPGAFADVSLPGSGGSFRWRAEDGTVKFSRSGGGVILHLLVRGPEGSGFGPPQRAVPYYDMPAKTAGLYGPILSGATLTLDSPASGDVRLSLNPSLDAPRVELLLGTNKVGSAHQGLPHEIEKVGWTAAQVVAVWASAPSGVELTAVAGQSAPVNVASFPGEFLDTPSSVDFTPAARSLLKESYAAGGDDDLQISVSAKTNSGGELVATSMSVAAHYLLHSTPEDGLAVRLRGSPASVDLPIAEGLAADGYTVTLDGVIGPKVKLVSSDHDAPGRRSGLRLAGTSRAARRLTLSDYEARRPLARLSLFGRADLPAELLLTVARDDAGRMGSPLGDPVVVQVDEGPLPGWHRVELPDSFPAPEAAAIWLSVQPAGGVFRWFTDAAEDNGPWCLASTDEGTTWSSLGLRPVTQIHYLTDSPDPSPIILRGLDGLLVADVLSLPAVRSVTEMTAAKAQQLGADAASSKPTAATTTITFRKEGVSPLADPAALAHAGASLRLTFDSERDADFRVLDAVAVYDPWNAA